MRRVPLLLAVVLVPIALAAHTPVGSCESPWQPALGIVQIGFTAETTFYLDDRGYLLGYGMFAYQESNGIWSEGLDWAHNLQRGGAPPWIPDRGDTCVDDFRLESDAMFL